MCEVDATAFPKSEEAQGVVNTMSWEDLELLESARKVGDWFMVEKIHAAIGSGVYENDF